MSGERRSVPARVGIVALNLLGPGLGLLRLGRLRAGIFFLAGTVLMAILIPVTAALLPELGYPGWIAWVASLGGGSVALLLASMWLSWRYSNVREALSRWSKWYVLAAAGTLAFLLLQVVTLSPGRSYKTYYLPSEGMAPTLMKGDDFIASPRRSGSPQRGEVLVFTVGKVAYVKRVAALPGDRIAMVGGQVVLNGRPVAQRLLGTEMLGQGPQQVRARRLRERFPGEALSHEIYDTGSTTFDDMAELRVPPGHLFVLGDNRDQSADSRVPREEMGVALLPVSDILGTALFHRWGSSRPTGTPIDG
ncbi:MAG TPA: signal peptidase I [Allosphingosinicella sp.]|jgi:signal peptidase I